MRKIQIYAAAVKGWEGRELLQNNWFAVADGGLISVDDATPELVASCCFFGAAALILNEEPITLWNDWGHGRTRIIDVNNAPGATKEKVLEEAKKLI